MERTRVLNVVYRSATALGSHLPSIASAKARVASAGALLRPVSTRTQVNIFVRKLTAPKIAIYLSVCLISLIILSKVLLQTCGYCTILERPALMY